MNGTVALQLEQNGPMELPRSDMRSWIGQKRPDMGRRVTLPATSSVFSLSMLKKGLLPEMGRQRSVRSTTCTGIDDGYRVNTSGAAPSLSGRTPDHVLIVAGAVKVGDQQAVNSLLIKLRLPKQEETDVCHCSPVKYRPSQHSGWTGSDIGTSMSRGG